MQISRTEIEANNKEHKSKPCPIQAATHMLDVVTKTKIYDDEISVHHPLKFAPATFHQPMSAIHGINEETHTKLIYSRTQKVMNEKINNITYQTTITQTIISYKKKLNTKALTENFDKDARASTSPALVWSPKY